MRLGAGVLVDFASTTLAVSLFYFCEHRTLTPINIYERKTYDRASDSSELMNRVGSKWVCLISFHRSKQFPNVALN